MEKLNDTDYTKRKALVVMKAIDPEQVGAALKGIGAGFFAVLATLKVKFAEQITLGYSIGEMLERFSHILSVDDHLEAHLAPAQDYHDPEPKTTLDSKALVGDGLKKWVSPVVSTICRCLGVLLGLLLSKVVWACHCSLRGGDLMVYGGIILATHFGLLPAEEAETPSAKTDIVAHGFKVGCGVLGFWWQLASGFSLPWVLWLFAMPLNILEWGMSIAVYWA